MLQGNARAANPSDLDQDFTGLETLEPRLLMNAASLETLLEQIQSDSSADATAEFTWSGYDPASADQAEMSYHFSGDPVLEQADVGYTVAIDGEDSWISMGDPIVPMRTSNILLPEGYIVTGVDVNLGEGQVVASAVELLAAPAASWSSDDPEAAPLTVVDNGFPNDSGVSFSNHTLSGYSYATLNLFPLAYDADSGSLTYYRDISVTIHTARGDTSDDSIRRTSTDDAERVLSLVDNDSAIHTYSTTGDGSTTSTGMGLPEAGQFEYVLVTTQDLADEFQTLVDHKNARGVSATLVTTEYITSTYTSSFAGEDDDAGRIREFLADAYANWGTQYVLLGGDTDVVAHRMVTVSANGHTMAYASDMYYACLDGPFNFDGDSVWAETTDGTAGADVDLAPELYVGRATVGNGTEATNYINKLITYETQEHINADTAVWTAAQLDSSTWGATSSEAIRDAVLPGDLNDVTLYQRDGTFSTASVTAALNDSPHIVSYIGHAHAGYDAGLYRADVDGLTNPFPFFHYSQGCQSGQFDKQAPYDALAEHLIKAEGGAFAAVMNSAFGWYVSGGFGGSDWWQQEYWDAVFNEGFNRVGEAHVDAHMDRAHSTSTGRWVFFSSTLFGDPETSFQFSRSAAPTIEAAVLQTADDGQAHIRLTFSEPMDQASFDPAEDLLELSGPGGMDLRPYLTGSGWLDVFTLDIAIDLPTLDSCRVILGPTVLDRTGQTMASSWEGLLQETQAGAVETIYQADMSVNPGWSLDAGSGDCAWQWEVPAGAAGDPVSGYTGSNVLGFNLQGNYGNYMTTTQYATSGPIDCSGFSDVHLNFMRWLGVENNRWDHASIDVSVDGTHWTNVWSNGDENIIDSSWSLQSLDLSAVADGESTVQIRFGIGPTDGSSNYAGWNIDDVEITGRRAAPAVLLAEAGGTQEHSIDHVDVTFTQQIDPASFTIDDVTLQAPDGSVVALVDVASVDGYTFRLTFDPQTAAGTYSLQVGPDICNLSGVALDQDRDGVRGEIGDDVFGATFFIEAGANQAPSVSITAPVSDPVAGEALLLDAAVQDDGQPDGTVGCLWTVVTAPDGADVTFADASAEDTSVTFSQAGTYTLRLTADDGDLSSSAEITLDVSEPNTAPVVTIDTQDTTHPIGDSLLLDATVVDDGLPVGTVGYQWSVVSAPTDGVVTFADSTAEDTSATFSKVGTYTLRLVADDGEYTSSDEITVTVEPENVAPVVSIDQPGGTPAVGDSLALEATVQDDGLPFGLVSYQWSTVSGPDGGVVSFADALAEDTTVTFNAAGTYTLQLTADDGEITGSNTVTVVVEESGSAGVADPDGLWWQLNDGTGSMASDSAGNSFAGWLHGGVGWTAQGYEAGGAIFNGQDGYIQTEDLGAMAEGSVSLWFRLDENFDSSSAESQALFGKFVDNSNNAHIVLRGSDYNGGGGAAGQIQVKLEHSREAIYLNSETSFWQAGEWNHVALVWDAGQTVLYVNGQAEASVGRSMSWLSGTGDRLGGGTQLEPFNGGGVKFFRGAMDDVRLYRRALGGEDMMQLADTAPTNHAPDVVIDTQPGSWLPDETIALDATVTDDDLPGATVGYQWSVVASPDGAVVSFADAGLEDTAVSFSEAGSYMLRLTADDGELAGFADLELVIRDPSGPVGPQPDVVWWSLDEGLGDVAHDGTGNGLDGLLYGDTAWDTQGRLNGSAVFDGDGDFIAGGDHEELASGSISLWFNVSEDFGPEAAETQGLYGAYSDISHNAHIVLRGSDYNGGGGSAGQLQVKVENDRQAVYLNSATDSWQAGQWNHVVLSWGDGMTTLWVNGEIEASGAGTVAWIGQGDHIGGGVTLEPFNGGGSRDFAGSMDDVRVFGSALEDLSVQELYGVEALQEATPASSSQPLTVETLSDAVVRADQQADAIQHRSGSETGPVGPDLALLRSAIQVSMTASRPQVGPATGDFPSWMGQLEQRQADGHWTDLRFDIQPSEADLLDVLQPMRL